MLKVGEEKRHFILKGKDLSVQSVAIPLRFKSYS